jgi:hypothetical protein
MAAGSDSDSRVPPPIRSTVEQHRARLANRAVGTVLGSRSVIRRHPDSILAEATPEDITLAVTIRADTTPEETASIGQAAETSRHPAITINRARSERILRQAEATATAAEGVPSSTIALHRGHATVRRLRNTIVHPQRRITALLPIVVVAEAAAVVPTVEAAGAAPTVVEVAALMAVAGGTTTKVS